MFLNLAAIQAEEKALDAKPFQMITSLPDPFPESAMIEFKAVTKIQDLLDRTSETVCLVFDESSLAILKTWTENLEVFPFTPVLLAGVPNTSATLDGAFENYTYNLGQVAYHDVVGDMTEAVRRAESLSESERDASQYKTEQSRITRKSGHVKDFTMFDSPNVPSKGPMVNTPDAADDDEETEVDADTVE